MARKLSLATKTRNQNQPEAAAKANVGEPRVKVPAGAATMSRNGPDELQEGRYVYGIIEVNESSAFGKTGLGGINENVYTVHHKDVAAVVSNTPIFIFDPTRENALAHEHVIENVMKTHTIIPMSFGTVFRTELDIKEVLKTIYPSLKDVLKQMACKLEFGIKVNWDRDRIIEQLKQEDEEIHKFQTELAKKHMLLGAHGIQRHQRHRLRQITDIVIRQLEQHRVGALRNQRADHAGLGMLERQRAGQSRQRIAALRIGRGAQIIRDQPQLVVAARLVGEAVEQFGERVHGAAAGAPSTVPSLSSSSP